MVFSQGHEKEALNLMSTYLPKDSGPGSAYSEGGGLFALGKIHFRFYYFIWFEKLRYQHIRIYSCPMV